jgi:hypothetical protein
VAEHAIQPPVSRSLVLLTAALAFSVLWQLAPVGGGYSRLTHVLALNVPISLLTWGLLAFVADRTSSWRFRLIALLAILASSIAAYCAIAAFHVERAPYRTFAPSPAAGAARPGTINSSNVGSDARQSLVSLSQIMNRQKSRLLLDHMAYISELGSMNLATLTSPAHIASADDVALVESRLSSAKAIVAKYRDLYDSRMAETRRDIATGALPPALKIQALQGFDASANLTRDKTRRLWADELAVLDQLGEQYEFLAGRRARWRLIGTQVVFNDPADLAVFNAHLAEMQRISADEVSVQRQINAGAQARLATLRGMGRPAAGAAPP